LRAGSQTLFLIRSIFLWDNCPILLVPVEDLLHLDDSWLDSKTNLKQNRNTRQGFSFKSTFIPMNVLKTPPFLRPSTPLSPAPSAVPARPESSHGMASFRGTKLSLGNFMRQPSLPTIAPPPPPPAPVPQDASYLEMLGLKLSEAVTRALAQPVGPPTASDLVSGKKPIPPGRGLALGSVIAS